MQASLIHYFSFLFVLMNFKLYSNPNTWQACCEKFADKQAVKEFFFSKIQKQQVEYTTVTKSW